MSGTTRLLFGKKRIRIPPAERVLRSHEAGRMEKLGNLNVLRLRGSSYQMGCQHGTLLKDEIASGFYEYYTGCITRLVEASARTGSASFVEYLRSIVRKRLFANWIYNRLLRTAPRAAKEEIQGLADGSGVPPEKILRAFVVADVFLYLVGLLFRTRRRVLPRALMPACSSLVAWGPATADGKLLHGRNLEFFGIGHWDTHPTVLFFEPEQGIPFVSVTTAGVGTGGITSMNEAGLTLALNVHLTRDIAAEGMPMIWIGNEIIRRSETIADAVRVASEFHPACGFSFTVAESRRPGAGVIEISAGRVKLRPATDSTLVMTNHYLTGDLKRDELDINTSIRLHTLGRYTRGLELLKERFGAMGVADMAEMLGDHQDPYTHRARAVGSVLAQPHNITSVVFVPQDRQLWVATGPAPVSHGPYVGLSLDEPIADGAGVFAGAGAGVGVGPAPSVVAPAAEVAVVGAGAPESPACPSPSEASYPFVEGTPWSGTSEFSAYQHYMKAYTSQLDGLPVDSILESLRLARAGDDQEPAYALVHGLYLLQTKRYAEAAEALEHAAGLPDLEHKHAVARFWKGVCLQLQGQTVAAQGEFLRVLSLHGAGDEIRKAAKDRWSRPFTEAELAAVEPDMVYTDVIS